MEVIAQELDRIAWELGRIALGIEINNVGILRKSWKLEKISLEL